MNRTFLQFGIAAILCFSILSGCVSAQQFGKQAASYLEAYQMCSKAQQALEDKDFQLADEACNKGLELLGKQDDPLKVNLLAIKAQAKMEQGDYASVVTIVDQALPLISRFEGRNSRSYASAITRKAFSTFYQGKFAAAEPLYYEAETLYDRLGAPQSKDKSLHSHYEGVLAGLFATLAANGNDVEACSAGRRLLIAQDSDVEDSDLNLKMLLANVLATDGEMLYKQRKNNLARPFFERSIRIYKQHMYQRSNPEGKRAVYTPSDIIITGMTHLGEIYEKSGRRKEGYLLKKEAYSWTCVNRRIDDE